MLQIIMNNQALIGAAIVAILDLIFALDPNVKSSGLLHMIYNFFVKQNPPSPPSPPAA